ncbi:MAG: acetate--CoA ligase family protein [Gaiellales bacterium]
MRDLRPLFDPRSVAVVGASNDAAKWGHWLARNALKGEHLRPVFLVNRNGGEILGRRAYHSLAELPEAPELVVLAVPAAGFEEAVEAALDAGAKGLIGITAGLGETDAEGRAREDAAVARVRAAGAVLLGPNCLGVIDAGTGLELSTNEMPAGTVGLVSQSGNVAIELALLAQEAGIGFSRFASVGNQADLNVADLSRDFTAHEPTTLIALYCEDFKDGRAFATAAQAAVEAGKAVVLLTVGASEAGARAARSHTGALVSELAAVEAASRAAGIHLVGTPKELIDLAQALVAGRLPGGRRVAVVSDGGGHSALAADLAVAHKLELPSPSRELANELGRVLPSPAAPANPVDLVDDQDLASFARVTRLLLGCGEVDAVLLTGYFGGYREYSPELAEREVEVAHELAAAAGESERPLIVHTMYGSSPAAEVLRNEHVPVYRDVDAAVRVLAQLAERSGRRPRGVADLPAAETEPSAAEGYWPARELLRAAGIEFVEARPAQTLEEALTAADELGYPVVVKALGQLHKSDTGAVAVGILGREALEQQLSNMATHASEGYSVERTAPTAEGIELIVGARRDRRFGPVVLVGLGGLYAEILRDVAVALAPVEEDEAAELLLSLRAAPLLEGARGRPPLDVAATARAVSSLSRVAASRPEIDEIEINPLLVTPRGALGLDARVVLSR